METTLQQSSAKQSVRTRIAAIEAVELASIGFVLWAFLIIISIATGDSSYGMWIFGLFIVEGGLLGSWAIYNLYIRIQRAAGSTLDVLIWVLASFLTASYTFWAWSILDINRWLMKKLFYRGEAPVEFAWSIRSKQIRKAWEQAHKLAAPKTM